MGERSSVISPTGRRKLRWSLLLFLAAVAYLGHNWWSFAHFDSDYRAALEEYVRRTPGDAEGWFALATTSDRADRFSMVLQIDHEALERAIRLDPRPLFILRSLDRKPSPEEMARLLTADPENAFTWLTDSGARLERGDLEGAVESATKARTCPSFINHAREAIEIHRRFLARFYGTGYRADSLLLRQEIAAPMSGQFHYFSGYAVEAEAARLRSGGDFDGAQGWLEFLYGIGCEARHRHLKWSAAMELAELSAERRNGKVLQWSQIAEQNDSGFGFLCGNSYADEDPWLARNSWPALVFYRESYSGIWLPLWYTLHRSDFRLIAEQLGNLDQAPWRRTDKYLAGSKAKSPRLEVVKSLAANQDVLYGPVEDEKTFLRLLDLTEQSDAAVLTLLKTTWKPALIPAEGLPAAKLYVLLKLGCLDIKSDELRRDVVHALTDKSSMPWAPDAWRLAARLDREVFIETAIQEVSWPGYRPYLQVLREVTGQRFGFEREKWQAWWSQAKPVKSK